MAKDKDQKGRPILQRSPHQASRNFGFDQQYWNGSKRQGNSLGAPQPKFLFLVRFIKTNTDGKSDWANAITLAVKSFDRPKVTPQVQEIKQYNKKRLVQTGVKYSPVNISFHDTADGTVSRMWKEYASYYFGDFRHDTDSDWNYDATVGTFNDNGKGFGLTQPVTTGGETDAFLLNSSNFFERIECYQFFGGMYTQFDLVRPKISSYDPDELDYEAPGGLSIRMTVEYESIIYHNESHPNPIKDAKTTNGATISAIMQQAGIDGDVYEPPAGYGPNLNNTNIPFYGNASRILSKIPTTQWGVFGKAGKIISEVPQVFFPQGTSALGSFGTFDFGQAASNNAFTQVGKAFQGAIGSFGTAGKNIVNGAESEINRVNNSSGVSASTLDASRGASQSMMNAGASEQGGLTTALAASSTNGSSLFSSLTSGRTTSQVGKRTDIGPVSDPNDRA